MKDERESQSSLAEVLLRPASIAIVGATETRGKRGRLAIETLVASGYKGHVIPVNPNRNVVLGLDCYASLLAIPMIPDVVVVAVPSSAATTVVSEAASVGVGACIVLGVGFREMGAAGLRLETEMRDAIAGTATRLIGPNTNGYVSSPRGVNVTGAADVPVGRVGLVTQSGNVALEVWERLRRLGDGVALYVGLGNKTDVGFVDILETVVPEAGLDVLILHIEDFGEGEHLLDSLELVARHYPVVAVVGGRTDRGSAVARTHTGAATGGSAAAVQLLEQAGVLVAETPRSAADLALGLRQRSAQTKSVLVISDGGGHAAIAADMFNQAGVQLHHINEVTRSRLSALLPNSATLVNPIDVAGRTDEDPDMFRAVAEAVVSDSSVSTIVLTGIIGGYGQRFGNLELVTREIETAGQLGDLAQREGLDLLVHTPFFEQKNEVAAALRTANVGVYENIDELATVLAFSAPSPRADHDPHRLPGGSCDVLDCHLGIPHILEGAVEEIPEDHARRFLEAHGIRTSEWRMVKRIDGPLLSSNDFNYPWVMKAVGWNAGHKSDWGGVVLGVRSDELAIDAAGRLTQAVRQQEGCAGFRSTGILVSPQISAESEAFIGATRHEQFGPVSLVGFGGRMADAFGAHTVRRGRLSYQQAREMILNSALATVTQSRRATFDLADESGRVLQRVASLIIDHPGLETIDLNPVLITQEGLEIVDVKITVRCGCAPDAPC